MASVAGGSAMTSRSFRDLREFRAWNDAMVARYDPERFHAHPSPVVRWIERRRSRRILSLLSPRPGDRVLEVGCGAANLLERVTSGRRFGLDLSWSLLGRAAARLGTARGLVQGDAERLPFRDGAFDRVFCSEVLEHLLDPGVAFAELHRVLTPTGIAVVSVPNEGLINRIKALLHGIGLYRLLAAAAPGEYATPRRMDDEWHLHAFDIESLQAIVPGGLAVLAVEGVPFAWLPLRYVLQCRPGEAPR